MTIAIDTYNTFYAIERRAAVELADALPFMQWSPAAVCVANIARHGAVRCGRMARVEYELWGGNARLLQVLRAVAGQVGRKALYATVFVGYMLFVAVALAYHYGSEWISSYVEASQQVGPVCQASNEVMAEMEVRPVADEEVGAVEPIQSASIDWELWGIRDLRASSQRAPFGIPSRDESGKMFSKAALVDMYTVALAVGAGPSFTWQEEVEAA